MGPGSLIGLTFPEDADSQACWELLELVTAQPNRLRAKSWMCFCTAAFIQNVLEFLGHSAFHPKPLLKSQQGRQQDYSGPGPSASLCLDFQSPQWGSGWKGPTRLMRKAHQPSLNFPF